MKRGQQIASTGEQEEVVWLGPRRVVLGMGAVMLPLSTGDLDQLSRVVARVDADFPRLARQGLAYVHCDPFVFRLAIIMLAICVGYYVVWSVTPALHTPLMSVTNAISSVIVVGALLAVGVDLVGEGAGMARMFGFAALVFASVNIFGGFLVTSRMLAMYKKKQ